MKVRHLVSLPVRCALSTLFIGLALGPMIGAQATRPPNSERPPPEPMRIPAVVTPDLLAHTDASDGPPSIGEDPGSEETSAVLPPGFVDQLVLADLNQAVGFTFAADGRMYLWEKSGRIWIVENDAMLPTPFLDISPEVGNWSDHGLLGFALDPDFYLNGHVYLLYVVDYHHLTKFGTPAYDDTANQYNRDTIGRITRYTANAEDGFTTVDQSTRLVLLGESIDTGIPICGSSHGVGSLAFGDDGTLLVSVGDGASGDGSNTCLPEGIIKPKEAIFPFRAQLVDSLSGKVLRLDPATGNGLPSNPFFDPGDLRAPRSRVWTLGLRSPCRMVVRAGTGSTDPIMGNPGTLYIGDVGDSVAEELDVVTHGGINLGWPIYEGLESSHLFIGAFFANQDAPNQLFGGSCTQQFFVFQDLLLQDSLLPPFWPNPCDPVQPIVTPAPTFVHTRPVLEWQHDGPARLPIYDAGGLADTVLVGDPSAPVPGEQFSGNCSIAGGFSAGTSFPPEYADSFFHADYGLGWIRNSVFDAQDRLVSLKTFAEAAGSVVCIGADPTLGDLWYINYTITGVGELRRIRYLTSNQPPVAQLNAVPTWGPAPLTVAFDATGSSDPEGASLSFVWDFGNGTPTSLLPQPVRVFPAEDITVDGSIVGLVFDLVPPGSTGFSNPDPEVVRDGDMPVAGTSDAQRQYDTIHVVKGVSDKNGMDSFGYTFPSLRTFVGLIYQEGMNYGGGGWLESWSIEVRHGDVWTPVSGVAVDPPYPGDTLLHYETYEFRFPPTIGDGIRLAGAPGGIGSLDFITIGELRVLASPSQPLLEPVNQAVTLTVLDNALAQDQATANVSLNNTPPTTSITLPVDLGTFSGVGPTPVVLRHDSTDVEQDDLTLDCEWQIILHHDNHTHPDPPLSACAGAALLLQHDACNGDVHYFEIRLTVTDALGLSDSMAHYLVPDCDRNMNGVDDALDIASGTSQDADADGIPDEAQVDCNRNGQPDLLELFFGYVADRDGNGVPDSCDPVWIQKAKGPKAVPP